VRHRPNKPEARRREGGAASRRDPRGRRVGVRRRGAGEAACAAWPACAARMRRLRRYTPPLRMAARRDRRRRRAPRNTRTVHRHAPVSTIRHHPPSCTGFSRSFSRVYGPCVPAHHYAPLHTPTPLPHKRLRLPRTHAYASPVHTLTPLRRPFGALRRITVYSGRGRSVSAPAYRPSAGTRRTRGLVYALMYARIYDIRPCIRAYVCAYI
jgi:hypothetical protein